MYTNIKCPYAELDKELNNGTCICKDNINDVEGDFEKFIESGLLEDEYIKHSHWELYEG